MLGAASNRPHQARLARWGVCPGQHLSCHASPIPANASCTRSRGALVSSSTRPRQLHTHNRPPQHLTRSLRVRLIVHCIILPFIVYRLVFLALCLCPALLVVPSLRPRRRGPIVELARRLRVVSDTATVCLTRSPGLRTQHPPAGRSVTLAGSKRYMENSAAGIAHGC
jgi:hypothetical protein